MGQFSYADDDLDEGRRTMERLAWRRPEALAVFGSPILFVIAALILALAGSAYWLGLLVIPAIWLASAWRHYLDMLGLKPMEYRSEEEKRLPSFNHFLVQVSDDGVRVETPHGWVLFRWGAFRQFRLTPALLILTDDHATTLLLPRRAFASEDLAALVALAQRKLR